MRMIISFNWTIGTLLLLFAFFYPILDEKMLTGARKDAAVQTVDRIGRGQRQYYQSHESYLAFQNSEMPKKLANNVGLNLHNDPNFIYDAFVEPNGSLVIRAQAQLARVKEGALPPLTLIYRRDKVSDKVTQEWQKLSGQPLGLF